MPSGNALALRHAVGMLLVFGGLLACAAPAGAQGLGVGARMTWVKGDSDADVDAVRMFGGQVRLLSARFGIELSLDRHEESSELLNAKVTEMPIQASLLWR